MGNLYVKQKVLSLGGKFSVKDERESERYFVEGSLLKIPKTFSISNFDGNEVALITKKPISFLPTFYVDVDGQERITIRKEFTFIKARYSIDAVDIEVNGNWWDMNFEVYQEGVLIGSVKKKWISFANRYELQIANEEMEPLLVALVIAIDYVKSSNAAVATTSI